MVRRSRTGCLTCRARKLKCSEERPVCRQCEKANRECLPASGVTFRHQQNPSMNGSSNGESSLKNFYGYRETFQKETTWVDIPRDLTFVHTNNPYEDEEDGPYIEEGDTLMEDEGASMPEPISTGSDFDIARHLAQAAFPSYATQGLEALSAVASRDQYSYAAPPATMSQHDHITSPLFSGSPPLSRISSNRNLDYILNPATTSVVSPITSNIDPRLNTDASDLSRILSHEDLDHTIGHVRTTSYSSSHGRPSLRGKGTNQHQLDRRTTLENPELAFLLRDFSERTGSWMDMFDLNLFFGTEVPVLAVRCPLLLYSCAATSAKSLSRVDGRRPIMGGQVVDSARRSKLESWPGTAMSVADLSNKAREYYDLAVSLLRQALAGATRPSTAALPDHASPGTIFAAQEKLLPTTDSDELMAATAILCVYEFLDASTPEWGRHLDGAKSLFDIANDRMVHLTLPSSPHVARTPVSQVSSAFDVPRRSLGPGRKAVFWCFARQDMLSAFISNTHTRLDTFDLDLWRSAGLKITSEGNIYPSNPLHPDYERDNAMADDMIGNALVWLIAKLVNFIAAGEGASNEVSPLGLGMRQREMLDYWQRLDLQLKAWHDGLPDSFCATSIRRAQTDMDIDEKWFPRPMCASTAQWWHFARIQLLHNKPHVTASTPLTAASRGRIGFGGDNAGTSLAARHASYASILQQSRDHAKEILAIGLGRSNEGMRVHSVQPLWTSGLVLGGSDGEEVSDATWMWRRNVVSQLRGIERDMGWASSFRVQSLLELWDLPLDWGFDCTLG